MYLNAALYSAQIYALVQDALLQNIQPQNLYVGIDRNRNLPVIVNLRGIPEIIPDIIGDTIQ
jgi:hypothetical protein